MTTHLSMSMFASKEDLLEAKLAQLEADNAALMEVVRAGLAMRIFTASGKDAFRAALSALPTHLKQEASK